MLEAIGVASIDELFTSIPSDIRLTRPLDLPPAMSEWELTRHMNVSASQNRHAGDTVCFLGGGAYDHFVPAVVDFVASRSEFYTSYTPYQPEVAQGNLQAFFEYQTLVTQLTGMDISNASMYDGASATVEAVVMALSAARGRNRVILPDSLHPDYRRVVATYLANLDAELVSLPTPDGRVTTETLAAELNDKTACVVLQHPNFFGCLEDAESVAKAVRECGALLIAVVDPVSLGLLRRPSDYGADIVVAEGQPLGIPLGFGGPYLGIMACREQFVRRMPGRLVGQTVDRRGKRCWVLTLQTREQHIRREKATSNICTNQGLLALRATVFLATLGKGGIRRMAEACARNAHYAKTQIIERTSWKPAFVHPTFKEFVIRAGSREKLEAAIAKAAEAGIFPGIPLSRWLPDMDDALLTAVTEKRTKAEIDRLVDCLQ
ncbi:aminomethyl-transferring glycine dehydrogenase subunit GcvPA [Thermostilla marina]